MRLIKKIEGVTHDDLLAVTSHNINLGKYCFDKSTTEWA